MEIFTGWPRWTITGPASVRAAAPDAERAASTAATSASGTTERSDKVFPPGIRARPPPVGLRTDRRQEATRTRPPHEGLEVVGERAREVLLRARAEDGATHFAPCEEHHRRQREDAVAVRDAGVLVDVDLHELDGL